MKFKKLKGGRLLRETKTGVRLRIRVQPGAKKNEILGPHGHQLKIRIQAPPVDGKANQAIETFLAQIFQIPTRQIQVVHGASSRHKEVELAGISIKRVQQILAQWLPTDGLD